MAQPPTKTTPRDLLRVIFRRRLLFLAGAGLFAFAALVGACWYPLKYTGLARFERRSDSASPDDRAFESLKLTLEHELIGKNAVEIAVERLEKDNLVPPLPRSRDGKLTVEGQMTRQELVRGLMAGLRASFDVRSPQVDLVSVTFTDRDSALAKELPNILVTGYIDRTSEQIVGNLTESHKFLGRQVNDANTRLQELMGKKINFEKQYAGQLPDSPGALNQQIERLAGEIDSIRRQRDSAERKLKNWKEVLARSGTADDLLLTMPGRAEETVPKEKSAPAPASGDAPGAKGGAGKTTPAAESKDQVAATHRADKAAAGPAKDKVPAEPAPKSAADSAAEKADKPEKNTSALDTERPPDQVVMVPNPELARLQDELRGFKKKLDSYKIESKMTEEHPLVITVRKQIADVEQRIAETPARVIQQQIYITPTMPFAPATPAAPGVPMVDPLREREHQLRAIMLAAEIAAAQEEVDVLTRDLQKREARLASLHDLLNNFEPVRQSYLQITKDVAAQSAEVERYQQQLTAINMSLAAEAAKHRTHLSQVELAQEQFRPSSPNLAYVLLFALVGGLAFGGGLVFLSNLMDRSIATTEEAADYFDLPVYGVVGEIVTPSQRTRRKIRRFIAGPAVTLVVLAALGLATLNIVLWLYYPQLHDAWRQSPAAFLGNQAASAVDNLKNWL